MRTESTLSCRYLEEPFLRFGHGGFHIDPKSGIARYGPSSVGTPRHPARVRVGIIGSAETASSAAEWILRTAMGVSGNETNPEFPGMQTDRGFFTELDLSPDCREHLSQSELAAVLRIRAAKERFEAALTLLHDKLRLLAEKDHPPQYVVLALPDTLFKRARSADFFEPRVGAVHRDLRRAFKAIAMQYRIPTQLLRQQTVAGTDPTHPSKIAWNFFTGLYFKAGGTPWTPTGLAPGTCYVGIGFYRPLGALRHLQTSLVQAFDENGDGLVLRGHDFEWDEEKEESRSPHLDGDRAFKLIDLILTRYQEEMKTMPRRVVVHKTSRYWPEERDGFRKALERRVSRFDLLALESEHAVRLLTESTRPPLRGTQFSVGELDYLYTNGFIAALREFHGLHVPSPLRIADHIGQDTSREELLREVLTLTKMNWNSARLGGAFPVTLKFSRLVGEILREVPPDKDALPQFKFYV